MQNDTVIEGLRMSGFTTREIEAFNNAVTLNGDPQPSLDHRDPAFIQMLSDRLELRSTLLRKYESEHKGTTIPRRNRQKWWGNIIDSFYRNGDVKSPWDWLQDVYAKGMGRPDVSFKTKPKPRDFVTSNRVDYIHSNLRKIVR